MTPQIVYPEVTIVWPKETDWLAGFNINPIVWPNEQDWTGFNVKPMLIYISAPYSLGDVVANVRYAIEIADKVLAKGHIPFIPHLSHLWHFISPKPYEEWMRIDSAFILRCDALLRVGGISIGADREVEIAKDTHIRVYYDILEVPNA